METKTQALSSPPMQPRREGSAGACEVSWIFNICLL